MLPIAASAPESCSAAVLLANVSGRLVPMAMIVMPVTLFLRPTTQPNSLPSYKMDKHEVSRREVCGGEKWYMTQ